MSIDEKYLIFAHYHSKGNIRKDIVNFLYEGKKYFKKIIFVSTKINSKKLKKISKKIKVIKRKNIGYDFYSYKVGWKFLSKMIDNNLDNKKLYFANSSVLFINPKKLIASIDEKMQQPYWDVVLFDDKELELLSNFGETIKFPSDNTARRAASVLATYILKKYAEDDYE